MGEEIRARLPRVIVSLVIVFFLYLTLDITPAFTEGIMMPGINISLTLIARLIILVIIFIFLARVLIDIRVLADKVTDPIVRLFGISEEKSMKRVARDIAYIILIVLLVEIAYPLLANVPTVGDPLGSISGLVAMGALFIFTYDMGRTLYELIVRRADDISDWLTESSKKIAGVRKVDE